MSSSRTSTRETSRSGDVYTTLIDSPSVKRTLVIICQRRPQLSRIEQRISHSRLTSCTSFHCFAQSCVHQVFGDSVFAVCCVGLHHFAAEFWSTIEQSVENWNR